MSDVDPDLVSPDAPAAPPRSNGELVFTEPWESRAFGVAVALHDAGVVDFEAFRTRLIGEIGDWEASHPAGDEDYRYYERWLTALERFGIQNAELRRLSPNWAENVVRFLTHPVVSSLLVTLGMLGILIELRTPGFGVAGAVGVGSLAAFFWGHWLVQLAGWGELLIALGGVALLLLEFFVIPGFGFAGIFRRDDDCRQPAKRGHRRLAARFRLRGVKAGDIAADQGRNHRSLGVVSLY